jgi:very-short-patch-repair endonuclease
MSINDKRWHTNASLWEKLRPIARKMRSKPTKAENLLWQRLRRHQLYSFSFRRQHSIGQFIVDFYCAKAKLIIEVEGEIHQYQKEEDLVRQKYLESLGLKLLRFSNNVILNNIHEVVKQIASYLPYSL